MKLTLEKFKVKLLGQIQKQYPESHIKDGEIIIRNGKKDFMISLDEIYQGYLISKSFSDIVKYFKNEINDFIVNNGEVNYHNIYPLIRNEEFAKDSRLQYIKKEFFLDLEIYLAEDRKEFFNFCGQEHNIDEVKALESSMFNINRIKNELEQIHPELKIFSAKFNSDYCCSLILNSNFKKQIREKVGQSFLIAIPSSSGILVATNQPENVFFLKELVKSDDDINKVSSRVYRVKGNTWEYAD